MTTKKESNKVPNKSIQEKDGLSTETVADFQSLIEDFALKNKLDLCDIVNLLYRFRIKDKSKYLPISIFHNDELSCLETIVKYLKETMQFSFHEIAVGLNRDDRTIWTTYKNASNKRNEPLVVKESEIEIPLAVFRERKLSVFETIVWFLKHNYNLKLSNIARYLNRDQRNVWAIYQKAIQKRKRLNLLLS